MFAYEKQNALVIIPENEPEVFSGEFVCLSIRGSHGLKDPEVDGKEEVGGVGSKPQPNLFGLFTLRLKQLLIELFSGFSSKKETKIHSG